MDKKVFSLSRDRVLDLKWEWLGPLEKILSTDPRGNRDAPALDQERTTHIVTALSDIDKIKAFLQVETIDVSWCARPSYHCASKAVIIFWVVNLTNESELLFLLAQNRACQQSMAS
jgi:hypothetical protein